MSRPSRCPYGDGVTIAYRAARCLTPDPALAEELVLQSVARAATESAPAASDLTMWFLRLFVLVVVSAAAVPHGGVMEAGGMIGVEPSLEDVLVAFLALPLEERLLTALSLSARLTATELARVTALPVAGVHDRLHRGRRLLRQALGDRSAMPVSRGEHP